jgi:hypothetical protein
LKLPRGDFTHKPRQFLRVEGSLGIEEVESLEEVIAVLLLKWRETRKETDGAAEFEKDVWKCASNAFIS